MTPRSPNKLLASLPRRVYARLQPHLRTVRLSNDGLLPHCGDTRVYFPGTGLCSIINTMADGALIEIASVGNEGVVGLTTLTGEAPPRRHKFLHVSDGTAQWMPLVLFERELHRDGALHELVDRFCRAFLESMIQAVACNRLHTLNERCARWLLTTHDRIGRAKFEMDHLTLARVLGVRPTDVEAVVMNFEQLGLIKQDVRTFTIFDAVGLKRLSCPCYNTLRRGYTEAQPDQVAGADEKSRARSVQPARILEMRPAGVTACSLCGSTTGLPHKSDHACIVALDEEIRALFTRVKALRSTRATLLSRRLSMYRSFLNNSGQLG